MFEYIQKHWRGLTLLSLAVVWYSAFFIYIRVNEAKFEKGLTPEDREHIATMRDRARLLEGGELLLMRDSSVNLVVSPGYSSGDIAIRSPYGTERWLLNSDKMIWGIMKIVVLEDCDVM